MRRICWERKEDKSKEKKTSFDMFSERIPSWDYALVHYWFVPVLIFTVLYQGVFAAERWMDRRKAENDRKRQEAARDFNKIASEQAASRQRMIDTLRIERTATQQQEQEKKSQDLQKRKEAELMKNPGKRLGGTLSSSRLVPVQK